MVALILFIAALALFLGDACGAKSPHVALTPLGLACATGALLAQMLLV